MNTSGFNESEIQQILGQIENKLVADTMNAENIMGRTLTVINGEVNKRSGGIMIGHDSKLESEYLGTYYNLDDILISLNDFLNNSKEESVSTFTEKGNIDLDQRVINHALSNFSSLYIEKLKKEQKEEMEKASQNGPDFYTVSRSDPNNDEVQRTGGLIVRHGMPLKEGQYVDEQLAAEIIKTGVIEIPSKVEIEQAVKSINKKPFISTFKKKFMNSELSERLKEIARKITEILIVPAMVISVSVPGLVSEKYLTDQFETPAIEQVVTNSFETSALEQGVADFSEPLSTITAVQDATHSLENGDIVELENGMTYDHNSQANDGISGEIGTTVRQSGDYTVDVIALTNPQTGEIIDYTDEYDGNLEDLLSINGLTMQDIENGNVTARYNVSEGQNPDLDRNNAAGWLTYDNHTYQDKGNIIQQALQNQELEQGGKTI